MAFSAWGADERRVIRLGACTLRRGDGTWDFARREAAAIEAHWQRRKATHPRMFNGVVQLLAAADLRDAQLTGECLVTDFKSFMYWKDHGYPDASIRDAFGSALLVSADDCVLLGRQGAGQLNSGLAYLPGGFIDARDVAADGTIAIADSTARELREETGLDREDAIRQPGAILTLCGMLASIAIVYRSPLTGAELARRIRAHIRADDDPELDDVVVVERRSDLAGIALAEYAEVLLEALFPAGGDRLRLDLPTQRLEAGRE